MERIRVAVIVFAVLLLLQIILAVRREHIRVEYSMAWFGATALLLALSLSQTALDWLSRVLGVNDAAFILLFVAGILFLFTFFRFSVQVSELKDHNIVLSQKVGLLEWEIKRQAAEIEQMKTQAREGNQESAKGA
ncbi:MAG: DUF2304 domain-containing protein [Bryobacterales bacterium]